MITSKNIRKVFFEGEKKTIFIILLISIFNLLLNFVTSASFNNSGEAIDDFLKQLILYVIIYGFAYMVSYAASQSYTIVPYLISLNCPKKLLAKNILIQGINRSAIVTLIFILTKFIVFDYKYLLFDNIFAINLLSLEIIDILTISIIFFLLSCFTYNIFSFFCLTGLTYGWQCVLASVFLLVGCCFFLIKQIVLIVGFGVGTNIFILVMLFINIILSISISRNIKNFEYKV